MADEVLVPELSWLLTVLFLALIILLVAMCVCPKQTENRSHEYGTAGRLSMTRDSPIFHHQDTSNGAVVTIKSGENDSLDEDGSLKRNSWTVKERALPDIPDANSISNSVLPFGEDRSEQPVDKTSQSKKKPHKHSAPRPPSFDPSAKDVSSDKAARKDQPHIMTIAVNDKNISRDAERPSTSGTLSTHPWSQVIDCVPCTSDGSVILKKIGNSTSNSSPTRRLSDSDAYNYDSTTNPYAEPHVDIVSQSSSPVCIHIGASNNSTEHEPVTPAGLAVAGVIPSSDIPYMTPPLLHNPLAGTGSDESPQRSGNSLAQRSEVPYTVISVREPLARVREMTMRKQRMIQQNSSDGENHYAMVPEEEQMYAEIGSGQDSGSSSITYAHIEPRELPPVPPTVESLKSVAHAHSRQASTVSNSSFGSCVSGSVENTSPTQLRNPSCLYSAVEKNGKQRRTIHIAEGASIMSTMDKHKKVEDLYAKVRKKRVELTLSASSSEEYSGYQGITGEDSENLTPPPSPWSSTTPPAPPPITGRLQASSLGMLTSSTSQHVRRHSADPNLSERIKEVEILENKHTSCLIASNKDNTAEPGYEQIYNSDNANESCYEKIKDECVEENENKLCYESIHHSDDNSFPGYASVKDPDKDSSDPGYECVAQLGGDSISSDPGYEPVRISLHLDEADSNHGYTTVNLDDETEPNYETVKKLYRTESDAVDPGYEKVKKLSRNDSDATDPGYERVHNKIGESVDPGYETVNRSDSDNEPGYEIVRHHNGSVEASSHDASTSVSKQSSFNSRASNSTILYVSGDSEPRITTKELISKDDDDDTSSEHNATATFL